jgi:hypothetical protein
MTPSNPFKRMDPVSRVLRHCALRSVLLLGGAWLLAPHALLAQSVANAPPVAMARHAAHAPRAQLASGAAFAPDGSLWMVGVDAQQQLYIARSTDLSTWSAPQLLDSAGDPISADGENHPKLAFGPNQQAVISYTRPLEKPYTGWIRMLRSTDGGASFAAPFTVHADTQEITHRFESIAFDGSGALHTLWIDKRDIQAVGKSYVGAAIYQNVSLDGGHSFGPDIKVADHSCECCRIALTQGPEGQLRALWRHVFGANTRDHAFANVSTPAPNTFRRASYDEWQIQACPHQGPGLARAGTSARDGYHAVWFGSRKEKGVDVAAVRYGRLAEDGQPLAATVRPLPDAQAEHADVASLGDKVAVVWRSFQGKETSLKAWLSHDGGKTFEVRLLAKTLGNNDQPRLIANDARMAVVWRTEERAEIHALTF